MTKISAEIVADSVNDFGNRVTTMLVTFPRYILAELNTHRMFSKNSASSRAIPFAKMVKAVQENPFIPIAWQKYHSGMQGTEYYSEEAIINHAKSVWLESRDNQVRLAKELSEGYKGQNPITKQFCNRLLESFMWHTVLITATEWENFFHLRCPQYTMLYSHNGEVRGKEVYRSKKDLMKAENISDVGVNWFKMNKGQAEIHMMALAEAMWDAYNESTPKKLAAGEWHIPFIDGINLLKLSELLPDAKTLPHPDDVGGSLHAVKEKISENFDINKGFKDSNDNYYPLYEYDLKQWFEDALVKISTAMCARTSYTVVGEEGKEPNYENDLKLHDRLSNSGHWSPFEHCARAMDTTEMRGYQGNVKFKRTESGGTFSSEAGWSGNFRGFIQYRKTFENENVTLKEYGTR